MAIRLRRLVHESVSGERYFTTFRAGELVLWSTQRTGLHVAAAPGGGPGELTGGFSMFAASPDLLWIRDNAWRLHRMNATHEIVDEHSATDLGLVQGSACALSRARFVTTLTSSSRAAYPARVVNLNGVIERSIRIAGWATQASDRRRLWCGADGRVYFSADPVSGAHQLRFIRWNTEGGSHNLVSIDLPWFEDGHPLGRTESLQQKPSSFLAEIRELNDHVLLMLIRTSDRRWAPATSRVEESARHDTNYDVHYVVVDLVRREVLADSLVDKASEAIGQFIGPRTSSWAVDHETEGLVRVIERRIRLDSARARNE